MAELTLSDVLKKIKKDFGDSVVKVGVESLDIDGILSLGSPSFDFFCPFMEVFLKVVLLSSVDQNQVEKQQLPS